jgi:23S rRNA pseudouridine2605 synthase/16S rRNA pseudouridine516 synthase
MPRLAKLIADAGIASRRKAADLVRSGRVRVDGEVVAEPGHAVDPQTQRVEVDGRTVRVQPKHYILLNKPRGPISAAADARGRRTVIDLLPDMDARLYPAGRLDADTEGLILITNDGALTYRLTHPRFGIEKVYEAEVNGRPSRSDLATLEKGILLEEGPTGPARTKLLRSGKHSSRVEIAVHAGRKRMVRRMFESVGHPVTALRRTRIGPLTLGDLEPGDWRPLTPAEIDALRSAVADAL